MPVHHSLTPSGFLATGDGAISGKHFVEFIFSPDFSGTVAGAPFLGIYNSGYRFPIPQAAVNTYSAIHYSIPSGSAIVMMY